MKGITTGQLKVFQESDVEIPVINVLDPESFNDAHIPGSINIPQSSGKFVKQVGEMIEAKDAPVVVYCASESCDTSQKAAEALEAAGYSKVYDYVGGIKAWKQADMPLSTAV